MRTGNPGGYGYGFVFGYFVFGMVLAVAGLFVVAACDMPTPTKATYAEQRPAPFFKVLVYEELQGWTIVTVLLFEDEAGNCYITSGTNGGISVAPVSACQKARTPNVEGR